MDSKPAWVCALSTLILAGTAHAQEATPQVSPQPAPQAYPYPPQPAPQAYPYPPHALAHISIQAAPSTTLEVAPLEGPAVARCAEYCEFWTTPGRYTVYARDPLGGKRHELSLRIKGSSRFELLTGDDEARATGLGVGLAGSLALLTGFILIMPAMLASEATETEQSAAIVGGALLIAGAITTPIGWSMYSHNRTRLKRIDERNDQATAPKIQLRVGVVGLGLGGLGLGAMATF